MSVNRLQHEFSAPEISEWMARDMLKDDDYRKELKAKMMTQDERNAAIKKMFGA